MEWRAEAQAVKKTLGTRNHGVGKRKRKEQVVKLIMGRGRLRKIKSVDMRREKKVDVLEG